jgi:hypothetical protein
MDNNYREEYRSYPTSKLLEIVSSAASEYSAEAVEAARAELTSRGESLAPSPAPSPRAGQQAAPAAPITLSGPAMSYLDQTRPWVHFMSILSFVGAGMMILMGFVIVAASMLGLGATGGSLPFRGLAGVFTGLFYMALAFLYIAPGVFLHRYAGAIRELKTAGTANALEEALKHQKSFWRYVGIVSAVSIALVIIAMVAGIALAFLFWFRLAHR